MTDPDPMKPTFPGDELDPYQSPKTPGEKKPRGCFFYGCIISLFAFVVLAIGIGLGAWYLVSKGNEYINQYTDTAPLPIPAVEMPAEEREALTKKVEEFKTEVDEKTAVEPLVLTSDQINALMDERPELKGRMHVDLEGDTIKGTVSIPFEKNAGPFKLKGRYLNAKGTFTASLVDGAIDVRVKEAEVRGMPIPPQFMSELSKQNLAKDVKLDEEARRTIARFERIEVKDGKLYIIPAKPSAEPAEDDATKVEADADADQPAAPSEDVPKEDAEPKQDAPPPADQPTIEPKAEDSDPQGPESTASPSVPDLSLLCFATDGFIMPTFPG
jgi:hypothetical protein